jgi:hypothetical protein
MNYIVILMSFQTIYSINYDKTKQGLKVISKLLVFILKSYSVLQNTQQ